jgi:hypothetical protein
MKHSRHDYVRIQDPAGLIPADEPVFLLRGQDKYAPDTLRDYAARVYDRGHGSSEACQEIYAHAELMEQWQADHGAKVPDAPNLLTPAQIIAAMCDELDALSVGLTYVHCNSVRAITERYRTRADTCV